jgi:exopolysaccharide biosynthesis polyprenyl glycosylphosphotransferase
MIPHPVNPALSSVSEDVAQEPVLGTTRTRRLVPIGRAEAGRVELSDRFWCLARLALDALLVGLAIVASNLAPPIAHVSADGYLWPSIFALIAIASLLSRGTYSRRLVVDLLDDLRSLVLAVGLAMMAVVTLRVTFFTTSQHIAAETIRLAVFAGLFLVAGRICLDISQTRARRSGYAVPTIIVGAGKVGQTTAKRLLEHPELGLRPVGFLDKEPREDVAAISRLPVLGASWDFEQVARVHGVGQVIITFSTAPSDVLLRMIRRSEELGMGVSLVPRLFEKVTDRLTINHLGGLPLLTSIPSNPRGRQFAIKYALDRLLALLMLVGCAPVILVAAVAVRVSLGKPVIFRQLRVGRDGRTFNMLKFRSMRPPDICLEEISTLPDDIAPGGVDNTDRRTRLGAFLRKSSIDELPQLFNVLKGDMSLIGPRPERPEYVEVFEERVYRYGDRHRVKSGITGWAQIHGLRGNTSLSDRVEWDNYYIENFSLWLDFKIALRTVLAVAGFFRAVK